MGYLAICPEVVATSPATLTRRESSVLLEPRLCLHLVSLIWAKMLGRIATWMFLSNGGSFSWVSLE